MDVILIRHGQSVANQKGLLISNSSDDLTDQGRIQSKALAALLAPELNNATQLVTSPWKRALSTAEIVFGDRMVETVVDDRITETFPGKHGSWLEADFNKTYPDFYNDLSRRYASGESHKEMSERVVGWVKDILLPQSNHDGLLVCVTHGGPISVILQYLMGMPFEDRYPSFIVPNASYTKLIWRMDLNRFCIVCAGLTAKSF